VPLYEELLEAVALIRQRTEGLQPSVGIILGSGLGGFAEVVEEPAVVPYSEVPHFPATSIIGHPGRLVLGRVGSLKVAVMQGRVHCYEGFSSSQVVFPARVLCLLGIKTLVVTNAAGGIRSDLVAGDLMAITDHINFAGCSPLLGSHDERLGARFPDMSGAYDAGLTGVLIDCARARGVSLKQGIYAMVLGPAYETPAEVRALRALGADAVGMSTVPEVVAARQMDVRVVGLSCITNTAADPRRMTHQQVTTIAARSAGALSELLASFLPMVAS